MGFVKVRGLIGRTTEELEEIEFLVDTGSFYTTVPQAIAQRLGLPVVTRDQVITADSRTVETPLTFAHVRLLDRSAAVPVGIMEVPMPLLGATALEGLGFKVDPVTGQLEPTRPFGLAAL